MSRAEGHDLYAEALAAGIVLGNHESDLDLTDTPEVRAMLDRWGWSWTTFRDAITGKPAIEVPFAFHPYWKGRTLSTEATR